MKLGLVYTSTTPELIAVVEEEVRKVLGESIVFQSYEDPSILREAIEAGKVTTSGAAKLMDLYMAAVKDGADVVYNLCSSVGEVADEAKSFMASLGIPLVRVDEWMCEKAVLEGNRIGVMATLPTTLNPTKNTLKRFAQMHQKEIVLVDGLLEGAFGLNQEKFKEKMLHKANELKDRVDILLFAQGSMAYCNSYIEENTGIKVFSSPSYGALAVAEAVKKKEK
ncbi:MAG: Asp/Glu/hydantoin racemase [Vallitaleaceae bacterium]|nr:Asp/Glu/hydantoin racemase [Vallitaleaceae bacterium]